jgi:hypothetical protein
MDSSARSTCPKHQGSEFRLQDREFGSQKLEPVLLKLYGQQAGGLAAGQTGFQCPEPSRLQPPPA